ncbi:MAG: phosphatidate cytidylyltransferase [Kiritimatiellae bacterium]|nr:phosphatidate cytidylyltransferase [Kiritimatiellia bacterium]
MQIAKRTLTALITAAIAVCALLYVPLAWLKIVLVALAVLVQLEFSQMVAKKYPVMVWPGIAAGVAYLVSSLYMWSAGFPIIVFALALAALFCKDRQPIASWGITLLGFIYIPVMMEYFYIIPARWGMTMLLYVISIVKISDMGGFAFGVAFGKHKMCPSISPGKSWEGMAGSIFASCLVSCAFMPLTHFSCPRALAFGLAAAFCGTLGDLVESGLKRECGVKDSATFMPAGMGGFLDMFDSILFAPAIFSFFL